MQRREQGHDRLTPAQRRAIALLLAGISYVDTAARVGVDVATLWRWRQRDAFTRVLEQAQDAALSAFHDRLVSMAESALDALQTAMAGQSDSAKVQAARAVLDRAFGPVTGQAYPAAQRTEVT